MKDSRYLLHLAGDPHEGTQACRRCGYVLREEDENMMAIAGPNGEPPVYRFFPAGAEITVGPGCSAIGADPRGITCR